MNKRKGGKGKGRKERRQDTENYDIFFLKFVS